MRIRSDVIIGAVEPIAITSIALIASRTEVSIALNFTSLDFKNFPHFNRISEQFLNINLC